MTTTGTVRGTARRAIIPSRIPYRGFANRIFLPYWYELLEATRGNAMPFGFVVFDTGDLNLPNGIASQDVAYGSVTQPEESYVTHLMASSWLTAGGKQAPGLLDGNFAVQFYDASRQKLWSEAPIQFLNALGGSVAFNPTATLPVAGFPNPVGSLPLFFKRPYRMPAGGALQTRVINLSSDTNQVQIVAWGYRQ